MHCSVLPSSLSFSFSWFNMIIICKLFFFFFNDENKLCFYPLNRLVDLFHFPGDFMLYYVRCANTCLELGRKWWKWRSCFWTEVVLFSHYFWRTNIFAENTGETLLEWCDRGWDMEKDACGGCYFSCCLDSSSCVGWACRGTGYRSW